MVNEKKYLTIYVNDNVNSIFSIQVSLLLVLISFPYKSLAKIIISQDHQEDNLALNDDHYPQFHGYQGAEIADLKHEEPEHVIDYYVSRLLRVKNNWQFLLFYKFEYLEGVFETSFNNNISSIIGYWQCRSIRSLIVYDMLSFHTFNRTLKVINSEVVLD